MPTPSSPSTYSIASQSRMANRWGMNITELSPAQLRRAADLKAKLEDAQAELISILGGAALHAWSPPAGKKVHWTQTPEGKARLARSMKRAWEKRRA